ncbi:Uncharacterised protein [Chlamydia trachomatis]|nr:Uncharacterised protein [Chlamydia trachomatis]
MSVLHDFGALVAQLQAGRRMNRVINAIVQWPKTAEQRRVRRVHDSVDAKSGDVSLPD